MDFSVKMKSWLFYVLHQTKWINGGDAYVPWVDDVTVLFWWLQMRVLLIVPLWAVGGVKMYEKD